MEILANKVRNNKNIKGINISSNKEVKQALFADDATFFLNDISSFEVLLSVIKEFSKFSTMKLNYTKSEAAWIGSQKQ